MFTKLCPEGVRGPRVRHEKLKKKMCGPTLIARSRPPDPLRTKCLRNLNICVFRTVPGDGQLQPYRGATKFQIINIYDEFQVPVESNTISNTTHNLQDTLWKHSQIQNQWMSLFRRILQIGAPARDESHQRAVPNQKRKTVLIRIPLLGLPTPPSRPINIYNNLKQ